MKKLITIILLLFTFVSNAQIEEEKTDTKSREEVISAPMLICSTDDKTKWFAIVPMFKKFDDVLVKIYLKTLKLNIGECSKEDVLVFTFKGGKKIRVAANNEKTCDGIVEINFTLNSIDAAFLETKPLDNIRYINGNDFVSFVYFSKPTDCNYFINTFAQYKN